MPPVDNVRDHVFTGQPWLAADPTLGPWQEPADLDVVQAGAWILPDERPSQPSWRRSWTPVPGWVNGGARGRPSAMWSEWVLIVPSAIGQSEPSRPGRARSVPDGAVIHGASGIPTVTAEQP